MTIFLWIAAIWLLPLWFAFRMWYFDEYFDGVDKTFTIFFICILSWIGLFVSAAIKSVDAKDMAKTFFIPYRENSMQNKVFWYKVRRFFLYFLLIKEPK